MLHRSTYTETGYVLLGSVQWGNYRMSLKYGGCVIKQGEALSKRHIIPKSWSYLHEVGISLAAGSNPRSRPRRNRRHHHRGCHPCVRHYGRLR